MSLVWLRGDHPCTDLIFNFCTEISRDIYVAVNHAHRLVIFSIYFFNDKKITLMNSIFQQKIQPDWWSKSFAGFCLGLSFAVLCASIITIWAMQNLSPALAPQFGMWSIPWIWLPVCFIAYFIPKGWQAILIYTLLNLFAYAVLCWMRGF